MPLTGARGLDVASTTCACVHGSAQNVSSLPRTLLLYEYGAADAWPLLNVAGPRGVRQPPDHGRADHRAPRDAGAGALPLPPARNQGSIYENQSDTGRRYFPVTDEPAPTPRT